MSEGENCAWGLSQAGTFVRQQGTVEGRPETEGICVYLPHLITHRVCFPESGNVMQDQGGQVLSQGQRRNVWNELEV